MQQATFSVWTSGSRRMQAHYFDGSSARAHTVTLSLRTEKKQRYLHVQGDAVDLRVPWRKVQWPERTRHGIRQAYLPQGGHVQCNDSAAWDAWMASQGHSESWVVTMQQSWRWVMTGVACLLVAALAMQLWGMPVAARALVRLIPAEAEQRLGESTLSTLDGTLMHPSQLPRDAQIRITQAFAEAVSHQDPARLRPWSVVFRKSDIGANALALPGGTIIMTDEMVQLVDGDTQVLTAVLAHELGHVQQRHGLRLLVQTSLLGAVGAIAFGDVSTLLATMPVLLGHAQYSRETEREADTHAVKILQDAGMSPLLMVKLFAALERQRHPQGTTPAANADKKPAAWLGTAFSSHPSDQERIDFFKKASTSPGSAP